MDKQDKKPKKEVKKEVAEDKKEDTLYDNDNYYKMSDLKAPLNTRWYVVHTYSGHEKKVATALKQRVAAMNLKDKIFEVVIPTRNIVVVRSGKKHDLKERIFPGYILVKMDLDDNSWLAVRTTQGVTAFVGTGNKPTPISQKEVDSILNLCIWRPRNTKQRSLLEKQLKLLTDHFQIF